MVQSAHTPATPPAVASWLADETRANIGAGNTQALIRAVATLAQAWMRSAGVHPACHRRVTYSEVAGGYRQTMTTPPDAGQRAFLAAGCDLLNVLSLAPEGRQAIHDLGFEPIPDHAET